MPQFFFNLHANGSVVCDDSGEWFPRVELAKKHALQVAYELSRNDTRRPTNERLSVVDERGTAICEIALDQPFFERGTPPRTEP
jgi:hypothetical protein